MPDYLRRVVPFHRNTNRRRTSGMNPIQSYKQVSVDGPASRAAATNIIHSYLAGVDNYAGPTAANSEVPTGARVMSVLVMATFSNLVGISALLHFDLQCHRANTPIVVPGVQGGNPERNTVIHTRMFFIGQNQNTSLMFRVKIPRIYQRIREGDSFNIVYRCDAIFTSATQVIYKFYR